MPQAAKKYVNNMARQKKKWNGTLPCRQYHRLYGLKAWKDMRLSHLARQPLCVHCLDEGRSMVADVVDHIVPHKGDCELFFDHCNLQSLCKQHHDIKTFDEMNNAFD